VTPDVLGKLSTSSWPTYCVHKDKEEEGEGRRKRSSVLDSSERREEEEERTPGGEPIKRLSVEFSLYSEPSIRIIASSTSKGYLVKGSAMSGKGRRRRGRTPLFPAHAVLCPRLFVDGFIRPPRRPLRKRSCFLLLQRFPAILLRFFRAAWRSEGAAE
jgi:hypothetical protein